MKHTPNTKRLAPVAWAVLGLAVALGGVPALKAQSNVDGAIAGKASGAGTVKVESASTGAMRTVTVGADGAFRAGSLPPGTYTVTFTDSNGVPVTRTVEVSINNTTPVELTPDAVKLEALTVEGDRVNPIDFQKTEASTTFSNRMLSVLPVQQTLSAVALLAPGTTQGDTAFGDLISFGGASVAENGYFVNGFNVSNFRNGLDPSGVPYEFYDQFEVKTDTYSAEFGRSTGGVINATTKRGTNTFSGGVSVYWSPAALRMTNPDIYYLNQDKGERNVFSHNTQDRKQDSKANFYLSGPIWKNKLFFYGIYTMRNESGRNIANQGSDLENFRDNEPFWGGKIDFTPFQNHHLEYTVFSDSSNMITKTYEYDYETLTQLSDKPKSTTFMKRGGKNQIGRYTGVLTENLTVSALYGKNRAEKTSGSSEDDKPGVYDTREDKADWVSGNPDLLVSSGYDEREAKRVDVEYTFDALGSHRLRFGYDAEENLSYSVDQYTGGVYWRYYTVTPGSSLGGGVVPSGVTEAVRERNYSNGGGFTVKTAAQYIEDSWTTLNDRMLLRLGLRNEMFENLNADGQSFIKIKEQLAPRLGVSYDLTGDKTTKVFANYGRYHLPIASNTNIRLAGSERYTQQYYAVSSINSDFTPVKGAKIGNETVYSDGTVKDRKRIVADNIKPMYQDEYVLGVQRKLSKNWTASVRTIYRNLETSIDDVIVDHALEAYAARNNIADWNEPGSHEYVLANPGNPITYWYDIDGDGTDDKIDLTTKDLGFEKAKRKYFSAELAVERIWDGKWQLQASYTWSQSYGNTEGWVKSDNGQDDAGITSDFDAVGLANGTYGFLPNDRRHKFKAFGSYQLTKRLQIGMNSRLTSGRPINRFGVYPVSIDPVATGYQNEAFWIGGDPANGEPGRATSRGDSGRTPWNFNIDVSVVYKPAWGKDHVTMGMYVYNLLNSHQASEVVETYEEATGRRNWRWGLPSSFQDPFSVELFTRLEF
jgi:hypothetical protein